jgi:hypothetical protein
MKNSIGFDLVKIMTTFDLVDTQECTHLNSWIAKRYELDAFEERVLDDLYLDLKTSGEYMNEEELKARMVGLIFYAAKVDIPNKIRVFYERPISANVQSHDLAVITDCMVASSIKSSPKTPYFFLQEFKKAKGEKKDPEAQMLTAMLIAQEKNQDGKPLYGGYMIGTGWHFATLIDKNYCVSEKFEATQKSQLNQIVFILRNLKTLILNR